MEGPIICYLYKWTIWRWNTFTNFTTISTPFEAEFAVHVTGDLVDLVTAHHYLKLTVLGIVFSVI